MRRQNVFQFKLIEVIFQSNELVKERHVYSVSVSVQSATGLMRPASCICDANPITLYMSWGCIADRIASNYPQIRKDINGFDRAGREVFKNVRCADAFAVERDICWY